MGTQVILNNVRLSFANSVLGEPEDYDNNGKFRHSATFIYAPGSSNDKAISEAILKEAQQVYGKKAETILDSLKRNPNKYCVVKNKSTSSGEVYAGFEDMLSVTGHRAAKEGRPLLLDSAKDSATGQAKILNGSEGRLYNGCYVNAKIEIWAQNGQYMGIRCGLLGIQFAKDGDSFGGASRPSAEGFVGAEIEESDLV